MYSNELICNILSYIETNIKNKITIDNLVEEFNYNRYYIMKLFKKELGVSIVDYINIVRIYNSLDYIRRDYSFLSCALFSGFYSLEYYSEMFKKILGVNPRIYKRVINNKVVDENYLNEFTKNLASIKMIINRCNEYRANISPTTLPIKKLSIFK